MKQAAKSFTDPKAAAAALLFAALAIAGSFQAFQVSSAYARQKPDSYGVAATQRRMAALAADLPKGAELTYITDLDRKHPLALSAYFACQFALAPALVLADAKDHPTEWAVGNFSKPVDYAKVGADLGFTVVRDYGAGVVLYRRAAR